MESNDIYIIILIGLLLIFILIAFNISILDNNFINNLIYKFNTFFDNNKNIFLNCFNRWDYLDNKNYYNYLNAKYYNNLKKFYNLKNYNHHLDYYNFLNEKYLNEKFISKKPNIRFKKVNNNNLNNNLNNNENNNENILEFYSMYDCPHCENFKNIWNKIKERNDIKTVTMSPSNPNYENNINKYNINEFPHIQKVLPNGNVIVYNGSRNYNSIIYWFFN